MVDAGVKQVLRESFESKNLTLYLGAGVSIDNNIPSWEKLILAMYFSTISEHHLGGVRPFSNYLYAISEWHIANSPEPLEITARKLRRYYDEKGGNRAFLESLYHTLYGGLLHRRGRPSPRINREFIRSHNPTMRAVSDLCESPRRGISAVITYNYDSLLEIALGKFPHKPVFRKTQRIGKKLPIYHVHGYVPLDPEERGSRAEDIVFTEDQYHRVSGDAYYWSNLVQLKNMSNSVGLMVGLSLEDRNMRRLLDAVGDSPIDSTNYALLRIPDEKPPGNRVLDRIHKNALKHLERFRESGIKSEQSERSGVVFRRPGIKGRGPGIKTALAGRNGEDVYRGQISRIIEEVNKVNREQQEYVLRQLRITPIWFKRFTDIPRIIEEIFFAEPKGSGRRRKTS